MNFGKCASGPTLFCFKFCCILKTMVLILWWYLVNSLYWLIVSYARQVFAAFFRFSILFLHFFIKPLICDHQVERFHDIESGHTIAWCCDDIYNINIVEHWRQWSIFSIPRKMIYLWAYLTMLYIAFRSPALLAEWAIDWVEFNKLKVSDKDKLCSFGD